MIILEILRNFFQEFENLFICKEFINCVGLGLGVGVWGWVGFRVKLFSTLCWKKNL